ncbi:MAG: hypothetical protein ACI38P_03910, partial [Cellulosimicrobium funkei]
MRVPAPPGDAHADVLMCGPSRLPAGVPHDGDRTVGDRMKTIDSLGDLRGKRVLVRSDFNVPLDGT